MPGFWQTHMAGSLSTLGTRPFLVSNVLRILIGNNTPLRIVIG